MKRRRIVRKDKPSRLVCADLHLTDNSKDSYKWLFFPWLKNRIVEGKVQRLYIVGDLCDRKDRHSSTLVNQIISWLLELTEVCEKIIIVKGNHDFDKDESNPFFEFVSAIPNIEFITDSTWIDDELFLPFTRSKHEYWNEYDLEEADYVYLHTDIIGAKVSDYYNLENGLDIKNFRNINSKFISGHIHVPQKLAKNFTYIGAPYPINFGDTYDGRVLYIDHNDKESFIEYPSIKKWSLSITKVKELKSVGFKKGDQVKIEMEIDQTDFHRWHDIRQEVKDFFINKGIELFSIEMHPKKKVNKKKDKAIITKNMSDPSNILDRFCENENVSEKQIEIGRELL
tara:strand:+ start:11833 stop:12855 length:1023 start_codon:yes stop_codon:yes gene_type:complete